jgi:NAD(P)-dependent dehydrogenase (short-subunit alcohol dehydrogenase family)
MTRPAASLALSHLRDQGGHMQDILSETGYSTTRSRACAIVESHETTMDLGLDGKLALITGGSRGIGRAIAEALAAEGCNLVLVSRNAADLNATRKHIEEATKISVCIDACDLADGANAPRLAALFPDAHILVNNAGAVPGGTLLDVDEARWRTAWDLKVLGTINMTRAFYPLMKARGDGVIINVIGNAAATRDPNYICSVTGNAGLTAFTEAIGSGSLHDGIRVLGVSPGPTATDRLAGLAGKRAKEKFGDETRWRELFGSLPGGRVGEPAEIAAMVAFLASPKSAYTSGIVVTLDAGVSSRAGAV